MPHIKDVSLEISREVSQFLFEVRLTVYYFMEFIELTSHSQPTYQNKIQVKELLFFLIDV